MNPLDTVEIGSTGLRVTRLGMGGAPIGGLLTDVAEEAAVQTVQHAWRLGVRLFRHSAPVRPRFKRDALRAGPGRDAPERARAFDQGRTPPRPDGDGAGRRPLASLSPSSAGLRLQP